MTSAQLFSSNFLQELPKQLQTLLSEAFHLAGSKKKEDFCLHLEDKVIVPKDLSYSQYLELIEEELAKMQLFSVLKQFILLTTKYSNADGLVNSSDVIDEYISKSDWRINANANISYSNAGLINQTAGKIVANYWLNEVYSAEEGMAHRVADLHIHDLDCLSGYCAGWSLRQLLDEGLNGVPGKVSSKAPKHLNEALGQMANFLGILQSEWAGAQAFSSFDTYLAPYVFKDNLSFTEVKKAIRRFVYNLNVASRWGQTPFTNITLDFTVPEDLRPQYPSRNNRHLFEGECDADLVARVKERGVASPEHLTYKDFQPELEMIDIAFYEIMSEGDSSQQPFTFPIPTVNITEDFDWESKAAKALFENTAKVGNSYFQNFIGSQYLVDEKGEKVNNPDAYAPNAVRSMCCRLQLDLRELLKRGNGLFGSAEMTGSIGVVTINMARLGYLFKGDMNGFYKRLAYLMDISKSTLEKKREFVKEMYDRGLYPFTKRYLRGFQNHFSTIGVNGMNEMILNYTDGKDDISTETGVAFCSEVLEFMRQRIKNYQSETGNLYNLEATPAEGTTYRFAKEDLKRYPDIIHAGQGDNVYYTNSSQLPVDYTDDPFLALEKQDVLQSKYTGGTVLHLYMSEKIDSATACSKLVKRVIENYKLPYITITPVFSVCAEHGYLSGEQKTCPKCNSETLVWTRVMGYHRAVSGFNLGKKGEHSDRLYFCTNLAVSKITN
ncbi:MAG: ribonucleoside triphosphate reductase [Rickettsiaceae bacterium]|nr:ribonucleoside triphosphate reductase [Rickettsiaceae bacterium]